MLSVRVSRAPQRHIEPKASGIFWRTRMRSTNANRVCSRWVQCEDFLYTNVMLPVVAEIIHVFESFVRLEAKVRESTAPSCITSYTAGCLLSFARPRNYRQPCRLADRHRAPHWRQGGGTNRTRTDRGSQARGRQEQSLISVSGSHSGASRRHCARSRLSRGR